MIDVLFWIFAVLLFLLVGYAVVRVFTFGISLSWLQANHWIKSKKGGI